MRVWIVKHTPKVAINGKKTPFFRLFTSWQQLTGSLHRQEHPAWFAPFEVYHANLSTGKLNEVTAMAVTCSIMESTSWDEGEPPIVLGKEEDEEAFSDALSKEESNNAKAG